LYMFFILKLYKITTYSFFVFNHINYLESKKKKIIFTSSFTTKHNLFNVQKEQSIFDIGTPRQCWCRSFFHIKFL